MSYIEELCNPELCLIFEHTLKEHNLHLLLNYLDQRQCGISSPTQLARDFEKYYRQQDSKLPVELLIKVLQQKIHNIQVIRA